MGRSNGFEHDALFYETDDQFAAALVPFLREGLRQGQAAVVATTRDHIALLRDELGRDAVSVHFIEDDEWYVRPARTIAGWQRWLDEFAAGGFAYTRVVGEVKFGSTDQTHATWTRFESALNAAFGHAPAWIVCPYNLRTQPERVLKDAWRTHPTIWTVEREPSHRYVDPAALLSEIHEPAPAVNGEPSLELVISDGLGDVRTLVRAIGDQARLPADRAEELTLVVSEIAANALRHGEGPCRLTLWVREDGVVCEVSDRGEGLHNPLAGYLPPEREASSGMGLWIAQHFCDSLAIRAGDHGTTVRFSFNR